MKSPWAMDERQRKIADYTDRLAEEISSSLRESDHVVFVDTHALDKNTGFIIEWKYRLKHSAEIMLARGRGDNRDYLVIDEFRGVAPVFDLGRSMASDPSELREAADIYENVHELLGNKFGQPVSGRGIHIYKIPLSSID